MCIICTQWEMYKDRNDVRKMIDRVRGGKGRELLITEEHLQQIEQGMKIRDLMEKHKDALSQLDDLDLLLNEEII